MSATNHDNRTPTSLRLYEGLLIGIASVCRLVTGLALVVLTVLFGWLVFGRYVLNETPTWVEQTALLLVMVIAFLGASVGIHEKTHLSVTIFVELAPKAIKSALLVLVDVILVLFGLLMLWYGWELTVFKWGSDIPLIKLPEGLRSLPLTIAGALIALFSIGHLWRRYVFRNRVEAENHDTESVSKDGDSSWG